jgi:hypothetical protein
MKTNFINGMLLVVLLALIAKPLLSKKEHEVKVVRWIVAMPNREVLISDEPMHSDNLVDTTITIDPDHADSIRGYWTGYCAAYTKIYFKH